MARPPRKKAPPAKAAKSGAGRPPFAPTPDQRRSVKALIAYGVTRVDIAKVIGIAPNTLNRHFEIELATGAVEANAKVAQALYNQAVVQGNVTAQIFWLKTKAKWIVAEHHEVNLGGSVGVHTEPVSETARWITQTLAQGSNGEAKEPLPN